MKTEITAYFAINNARMWVKGAITEGDNILYWNEKMSHYMENLMTSDRKDGENIRDMEFLHRQYFISSLNQAMEWIKESVKHEPSMRLVFDSINKEFPNIKDVRNMNEHDISYYQGKGHKQKDFMKSVEGYEGIVADATSTIIMGDGYLIGGRLNLENVISHLEEIYPILESKLKTAIEDD